MALNVPPMKDWGKMPQITAPVARFEQVADYYAGLVAEGRIQPGDRLPTISLMGAVFGCTRGTAARAVRELKRRGLVRTEAGRYGGIFATRPGA